MREVSNSAVKVTADTHPQHLFRVKFFYSFHLNFGHKLGLGRLKVEEVQRFSATTTRGCSVPNIK